MKTQGCCVCGEETENRCSACSASGITLFFCSREHQKLIWKNAHSKVCGKNAAPFLPLDLSKNEADEAVRFGRIEAAKLGESRGARIFDQAPPSASYVSVNSLAGALEFLAGVRLEHFEQLAPKLLQNTARFEVLTRCEILRHARGCVHAVVDQAPSGTKVADLSPFHQVAAFQQRMVHLSPVLCEHPEDLDQISHLALVLFKLIHLKAQSFPSMPYDLQYAFHAFKQVVFAAFALVEPKTLKRAEEVFQSIFTLTKPTLRFDVAYTIDSDGETFQLHALTIHPKDESQPFIPMNQRRDQGVAFRA